MPEFEEELVAYLEADPSIAAAVGQRITPGRLTLGEATAVPALTWERISTLAPHTHDNAGGAGTVLVKTRIQIDAWASTRLAAIQLARLVKDRLNGLRATLGAYRTTIQIEGDRDVIDAETELRRRQVDALITYEEAI